MTESVHAEALRYAKAFLTAYGTNDTEGATRLMSDLRAEDLRLILLTFDRTIQVSLGMARRLCEMTGLDMMALLRQAFLDDAREDPEPFF